MPLVGQPYHKNNSSIHHHFSSNTCLRLFSEAFRVYFGIIIVFSFWKLTLISILMINIAILIMYIVLCLSNLDKE